MAEFRFERNRRLQEEQQKRLYDRQQKVVDMRVGLEERGLSPEEADSAVSNWVRTGEWNIPTARNAFPKMEPGPDGKMAYGPPQPVRQPISLRKREDIDLPYQVNDAGTVIEPEVEEGFLESLSSQGYRAKPKFSVQRPLKEDKDQPRDGDDVFVDPVTGKELGRIPNKRSFNRTVKGTPPPRAPGGGRGGGGGGGAEDPRSKAARGTLAEYDRMLKTGEKINPDLETRAAQAAKFLGLPVEEVINEPHKFFKFFGAEATKFQRPGFVNGEPPPAGAPKAVTPATRQRAAEFLKANGKQATPANIAAIIERGLVN